MRKGLVAGLLAGVVFVATPTIAVALAVADGPEDLAPAAGTVRPSAAEDDDETESETETDTEPEAKKDGGPPPWAKAAKDRAHRDKHKDKGKNAAWKQAWKDLSPEQRSRRMSDLAKAHAEGMRAFGECAEAAGDDDVKRKACVKPLPPGQAKKQP